MLNGLRARPGADVSPTERRATDKQGSGTPMKGRNTEERGSGNSSGGFSDRSEVAIFLPWVPSFISLFMLSLSHLGLDGVPSLPFVDMIVSLAFVFVQLWWSLDPGSSQTCATTYIAAFRSFIDCGKNEGIGIGRDMMSGPATGISRHEQNGTKVRWKLMSRVPHE